MNNFDNKYSVEIFIKIINKLSYKNSEELFSDLNNITFFMGAGFSKAWDSNYPTKEKLFNMTPSNFSGIFGEYLQNIGYPNDSILDFNKLKDIVYRLNMQLKYEELRGRYIDEQAIHIILNEIKLFVYNKFKSLTSLYTISLSDFENSSFEFNLNQNRIIEFFYYLYSQSTARNRIPEGVGINFITTNYDFVIETILNKLVPNNNSFFNYTYRGITPIKINDSTENIHIYNNFFINNLIKLNGGFEIFEHQNKYFLNYLPINPASKKEQAPLIILPNREQDYSDKYFREVFPKAVRLLQESKVLIIVGYSLSQEDALLRLILNKFAEDIFDASKKTLFYINPNLNNIDIFYDIYPFFKSSDMFKIYLYKGTFNNFIDNVLENSR